MIVSREDDHAAPRKDGRFTIALKPFHYWSQTVTKRPFLIVSQRSFATEARAVEEAAWLFENVRWRRVGRALRAPVEFACRAHQLRAYLSDSTHRETRRAAFPHVPGGPRLGLLNSCLTWRCRGLS